MSKVAIISSVYNKEPYLKRCFDSIRNQTFKDFEFIIVNNASEDNSQRIIDEYLRLDKRFKCIQLNTNIGPAGGYETGLEAVESDYFTIVDADDYIDHDYIETLYKAASENDADISMVRNDLVYSDGKDEQKPYIGPDKFVADRDEIQKLLPQLLDEKHQYDSKYLVPELGGVWLKLFRTEVIRNHHIYYDKRFFTWNDYIFNIQAFHYANRLCFVNKTLYHFYQSAGSVTRNGGYNNKKEQWFVSAIDELSKYVNEYKDENLTTAFYIYCFNCVFDVAIECVNGIYYKKISKKSFGELLRRINSNQHIKPALNYVRKNGTRKQKFNSFFLQGKCTSLYLSFRISRLKRQLKRLGTC